MNRLLFEIDIRILKFLGNLKFFLGIFVCLESILGIEFVVLVVLARFWSLENLVGKLV